VKELAQVLDQMAAKRGGRTDQPPQAAAPTQEKRAMRDWCGPDCPLCEGLGYVYATSADDIHAPGFGRLVLCPRNPARERRLLAQVGLRRPMPRLDEVTPRSVKQRAALAALQRVLEHGGGVYLYGPPGRGKTYLVRSAIWTAALAGREAVYVRMSDLLGELRDAVGDRSRSVVETRRKWERIPVLAIDEPEKARPDTEFAKEHLFTLFDVRFEAAEDGLLLASNEPPEYFGPYLASRFRARKHGFVALAIDDLDDQRR